MINRKIVLHFPGSLVNQPIVVTLVKKYDLSFNILKAQILPDEEGIMVLELSGEDEKYSEGIEYLKGIGVKVQPLSKEITRDEDKCTHCGVCVAMCPAGALLVDEVTRKIEFNSEKCIACELCIDPCPARAMEMQF